MENKTRGNGKTKKVVIGVATIVAVAAIAVPTALTLTGGKDDAGANQGNKYNIVVSCGIDGVSDYSLSVSEGTKISELKSILKGVDGYKIEGIYKDDAMNHPYSDNETISSSTKIYIKFVAVTYTVNIYAEDGTTLVSTEEVNHKDSLTLTAPTKAEDNFATYEFKGWYNERNEQVNLNEITSDLNIHPYYETHMKDYRIGFIYEAFKSSVSVSIGGTPVTLDSTYHYGAKIVIRATQKVGRDITEFKVKVGSGETQNILTEAYRHEENGVVYYEVELDGNGDLSITYNEAASEYSIGQIPTQVTVTRNGHTLSSNEAIYYGDQLNISYTESEGHHKETFAVNGAEYASGVWVVKGDLSIEYTESRNAYVLGSIPSGVTVKCGEELLSSNSTIYYGDELTFTYTESSRRDTGNTKQEEGYNYSEIETTVYSLSANAISLASGRTFVVNGDVSLVLNSTTSLSWERGTRIEYRLVSVPPEVTIKRNGITLSSSDKIYYGDQLSISHGLYSGFNVTKFEVKGTTNISGGVYKVLGDIEITLSYYHTYLSFAECDGGVEVSSYNKYISKSEIVIPAIYQGKSVVGIADRESNTGVFANTSLTSISLPNTIRKIGSYAFYGCTSLNSITIPSSVSIIDATAFEGCTNLADVTIDSLTIYSGINGNSSNPLSGLIANATKIRVPKSYLDFMQNAYLMGENFASYVEGDYYIFVPASEFSYLGFRSCEGGIEVSSFDGSVTEVIIPARYRGQKVIGIKDSTYHLGPFSMSRLTSVIVSEGVEYIGDHAFDECSAMKTFILPSTIKRIGNYIFIGWGSNLVNLIVADGEYFTSKDNSGNELNCIINKTTKQIIRACESSIIPNDGSVISIEYSAFSQCRNLTSIVIPEQIEFLEDNLFSYCDKLTNVTIESSEIYRAANGVNGNNAGKILAKAKEVKVLKTADDGSNTFLNENFTRTDGGDYWIYTKN